MNIISAKARAISERLYQADLTLQSRFPLLAGVDEAGRGPIAGPVVVAAVILQPGVWIAGLNDSKQLSARMRDYLAAEIKAAELASAVIFVSPGQIDQLNILQATLWGMKSALQSLKKTPDLVLIDGNKAPQGLDIPCRTVVKGDSKHACIAAASVLAKTIRDAAMEEYELEYPGYGFAKHKGYPTVRHIEALSRLGLSSIHRLSYAPCQQLTIFTRNG